MADLKDDDVKQPSEQERAAERKPEYACIECRRLFAFGDELLFPEWQHEDCGGLVRKFAPAHVAAVENQVEARDAAVRLALLDEIESAMFGFFKRNPDHAFTAVLPMTIRELRIKYTRTP